MAAVYLLILGTVGGLIVTTIADCISEYFL